MILPQIWPRQYYLGLNQAKAMVDDFIFLVKFMASIAGLITPLWLAGFYLIQLWWDRRYPLHDEMPEPHNPLRKCDCSYQRDSCHCDVER